MPFTNVYTVRLDVRDDQSGRSRASVKADIQRVLDTALGGFDFHGFTVLDTATVAEVVD